MADLTPAEKEIVERIYWIVKTITLVDPWRTPIRYQGPTRVYEIFMMSLYDLIRLHDRVLTYRQLSSPLKLLQNILDMKEDIQETLDFLTKEQYEDFERLRHERKPFVEAFMGERKVCDILMEELVIHTSNQEEKTTWFAKKRKLHSLRRLRDKLVPKFITLAQEITGS